MSHKATRKSKFQKLLNLHPTETTLITGSICDDYMTKDKTLWNYSECCQDPYNWIGYGDFIPIKDDPYMIYGYTQARWCKCKVCDTHVIGTEYLKEHDPYDRTMEAK